MRNIPRHRNYPDPYESKEQEIDTSTKVRRPLLIVAILAAVGFGLVYASSSSTTADASRFWVNTVTAETMPTN